MLDKSEFQKRLLSVVEELCSIPEGASRLYNETLIKEVAKHEILVGEARDKTNHILDGIFLILAVDETTLKGAAIQEILLERAWEYYYRYVPRPIIHI